MKLKKTEKTIYEVCSFWDKNGEETNNRKDMTIMAVSAINGTMKGISRPRSMSIARSLKLKVGDKYIETITYEKKN